MSFLSEIRPESLRGNRQADTLLQAEGLGRDGNLDYTCSLFAEDWNLIATGSCFWNTLRCLAVSREHQGVGC